MKAPTWCNNLKCLFHHNRLLYTFTIFKFENIKKLISIKITVLWLFFTHGATASTGPTPTPYRGFKITLRHTTFGMTLWRRDQPVAEASTWQNTTLTRDRHQCTGGIFFFLVKLVLYCSFLGLHYCSFVHLFRVMLGTGFQWVLWSSGGWEIPSVCYLIPMCVLCVLFGWWRWFFLYCCFLSFSYLVIQRRL